MKWELKFNKIFYKHNSKEIKILTDNSIALDPSSFLTVVSKDYIDSIDEHFFKKYSDVCHYIDIDEEYSSFARFPDLILMDGGKGQVNVALKVLDELKLNIPVCGMVNDDNHRTRGLYVDGKEIPIEKRSEGFKLITRIQDEAHRFAIEFHKSLREKDQVHSIFDDIPGIGDKRRRMLMRSFGSIDEVKNATAKEIALRTDFPMNVATSVYEFFHKNDE